MNENIIQVNSVKPDLTLDLNDQLYRLVSIDDEIQLDNGILSVEEFMRNNNGFEKSDTEKDELYGNVQGLYKSFQSLLRTCKFKFYLNRPQYNLITDLILKKIEYDVNTLFIAIDLHDMLLKMKGTKYNNDTDVIAFDVNATEITYVYHIIQGHKVKGLSNEAFTFSKILLRIGEISKIVGYYDNYAKSLTDEINKWALQLDSDLSSDKLVLNKEEN